MVAITTMAQAALLGASTASAAQSFKTNTMEIEVKVNGWRKSLPEAIDRWRLVQEHNSDGCAARLTVRPQIGNDFHMDHDVNNLLMQDKTNVVSRNTNSTAIVKVNLPGDRKSPLSSTNWVTTTCNDEKYSDADQWEVIQDGDVEKLQYGSGSFMACPNYVIGLGGRDYKEIYLGYKEEGKDPIPACADITLFPLWNEAETEL